MEYITALSNEGGGRLILGIDNKKKTVGTNAFKDIERLKVDVFNSVNINQKIRIGIEEIFDNNKRILVISISKRPIGQPISYKGKYLMRAGESLVPMDNLTLKNTLSEVEKDFSAELCNDISINELDERAIKQLKLLLSKKSGKKEYLESSNEQVLNDLDLITNNKVTYAALILLGEKDNINKLLRCAEVTWEYRNDLSSIEYQDRVDFKGAFLLYFEDLWNKINSRNDLHHIQQGFLIRDIPSYNEEVMREAILNAIAHRDYRDQGSVFIKQYPVKIEIINPGGFLPGITPENLIEASSKPRNRLVIEVFQKIGFVERSGQGVDKIFRQTISEGKGLPDYTESDSNQVKLIIDSTIKDKEFVKYLEQVSKETSVALSVNDLITLEKIKNNEKTSTGSKIIRRLLNNDLIEKAGQKYILSKKYYEDIGKKGEYTRRKGLDKNTNKTLILSHLKLHKKGYMKEFVEALKDVPNKTINRYLYELKEEGKIELIGNPSISRGANQAYWRLKKTT